MGVVIMAVDKQFWKKKYSWSGGVNRVKKVIEALKVKGIEAKPFSDDALSEKFIEETEHEKGEPDLKIKVGDNEEAVLLEVTGPDISMSRDKPLWFRPDKFEYAERHADKEIWGAHILESEGDLVRLIKFEKGVKDKYKTIHPNIRGTTETYKEIPADDQNIVSFDEFCEKIKEKQ